MDKDLDELRFTLMAFAKANWSGEKNKISFKIRTKNLIKIF